MACNLVTWKSLRKGITHIKHPDIITKHTFIILSAALKSSRSKEKVPPVEGWLLPFLLPACKSHTQNARWNSTEGRNALYGQTTWQCCPTLHSRCCTFPALCREIKWPIRPSYTSHDSYEREEFVRSENKYMPPIFPLQVQEFLLEKKTS